jgi:hypothetical protein
MATTVKSHGGWKQRWATRTRRKASHVVTRKPSQVSEPAYKSRGRHGPRAATILAAQEKPGDSCQPPMASAAADVVVVFDFDRTIIDWDSDDWVITKLGAADAFQRLRPTMSWNPLMVRSTSQLTVSTTPRLVQVNDTHRLCRSLPAMPFFPFDRTG